MDLMDGKAKEVREELLAWFKASQSAEWRSLAEVRGTFADADLVGELLVFNIRHNRYRLIVYPSFRRLTLYIKALLDHKEYDKGDWKKRWP